MIRRREFITLLGAAAWPMSARAQVTGKVWRVGILGAASREASVVENYAALQQGMRGLGYVEGKDFVVDFGEADGRWTTTADKAAELVRQKADMILVSNLVGIDAARAATRTIPIIMVGMVDPVGSGFVASLPRPGGNVTGTANSSDDTAPKQLELLAEFVPKGARIAVLGNPDAAGYASTVRIVQATGQKAGLAIIAMEARNLPEIEAAFAAIVRERAQAVLLTPSALFAQHRIRMVELALSNRLPSSLSVREWARDGGLMSYGQSFAEFWRQSATFVHKIMRGAKPEDLAVEQPSRFHLVINRKTADALGLTIPPILYIFADEVIE
jgi:putative ABC transport system substrate-binding protein